MVQNLYERDVNHFQIWICSRQKQMYYPIIVCIAVHVRWFLWLGITCTDNEQREGHRKHASTVGNGDQNYNMHLYPMILPHESYTKVTTKGSQWEDKSAPNSHHRWVSVQLSCEQRFSQNLCVSFLSAVMFLCRTFPYRECVVVGITSEKILTAPLWLPSCNDAFIMCDRIWEKGPYRAFLNFHFKTLTTWKI